MNDFFKTTKIDEKQCTEKLFTFLAVNSDITKLAFNIQAENSLKYNSMNLKKTLGKLKV